MSEEQVHVTKPSIIVSQDVSLATSKRITYIDGRIHENPESFVESLQKIGKVATDQTVEIGNRGTIVRNLRRKPADLITEFFKDRYDLDSEYDKTTEGLIAADSDYQQLVAAMRSKTSDRIQTGTMKSENRPSVEAAPARDLARLKRFGIYLGRVTLYHDQQQLAQEAEVAL